MLWFPPRCLDEVSGPWLCSELCLEGAAKVLLPALLHEHHVPAKSQPTLGSCSCPSPHPGHRAGPRPLLPAPSVAHNTQAKPRASLERICWSFEPFSACTEADSRDFLVDSLREEMEIIPLWGWRTWKCPSAGLLLVKFPGSGSVISHQSGQEKPLIPE